MPSCVLLSGGIGLRMCEKKPKQYIEVNGKPIIQYSLETLQKHNRIDTICIVAHPDWLNFIQKIVDDNNITKAYCYALAGKSRQHSIVNGLIELGKKSDDDIVIIHDAVRPLVSKEIISDCIELLSVSDCSMPVIPVKDTIYYSEDGNKVSSLLNRDKLFAGQTPEGCHLKKYLEICSDMTDEELSSVRGTSAIAYQRGLSVGMFSGSEMNYKITTKDDLKRFFVDVEKYESI